MQTSKIFATKSETFFENYGVSAREKGLK